LSKGVDRYGTGGHVPQYLDWGHYHECPALFEDSSQVELSLFVDFMAFCFTKTSILLSGVTDGGRGGQLPPSAAGKGAQNSLTRNILFYD